MTFSFFLYFRSLSQLLKDWKSKNLLKGFIYPLKFVFKEHFEYGEIFLCSYRTQNSCKYFAKNCRFWAKQKLGNFIYICKICCCCCLIAKSCPTLLQPHGLWPARLLCPNGISQARILKWVAISFSRVSSWPKIWTPVSYIDRQILDHWVAREAHREFYVTPKVYAYIARKNEDQYQKDTSRL